MVTPFIGNHEMDFPGTASIYNGTDSGGECGVPYSRRFIMPTTGKIFPPKKNLPKKIEKISKIHVKS